MNKEMKLREARIEAMKRIMTIMASNVDDKELRIQGIIGVLGVIEGKRVIQ